MVWVPPTEGVKFTEQEPLLSVQLVPGEEKAPAPLLVKLTVPVGVLGVPESVSATVAVQVVVEPPFTGDGKHATLVLVVRLTVNVAEALSAGEALSLAKTVWSPVAAPAGTVIEQLNEPEAFDVHGFGVVVSVVPPEPSHLIVIVLLAPK